MSNQPEWRMTEQEKLLARLLEVRGRLESALEWLPPTAAEEQVRMTEAFRAADLAWEGKR